MDWFNRVEFLNLHQHDDVQKRFPMIDHDRAMGEIHIVTERGKIFTGFAGTRRMLRELPLGLPFYAVFRLPIIGDWIGPRVYRLIARHRYAINRLFGVELETEACQDGVCKLH
ncbi:MAG: hypothetical protein CUN56_06630 [Phototrophicales bacterium]|nr:MAG: hypothetical protein CUN56_06630 [Phototrophicales bacterium]